MEVLIYKNIRYNKIYIKHYSMDDSRIRITIVGEDEIIIPLSSRHIYEVFDKLDQGLKEKKEVDLDEIINKITYKVI